MKIGKSLLVQKKAQYTGHRDCVYALEQGANEHTFFSSGGDGFLVGWDLRKPDTGQLMAQIPSSVYALYHHKPSQTLFVGQNGDGLHAIDLAQNKEAKSLHLGSFLIFDITLVVDTLVVAAENGNIYLVDFQFFTIKNIFSFSDKSARCLAFSRVHNQLAVGYSDGFIRIFDTDTWTLAQQWQAHDLSVFTLQYSPCGRWLVSGGRDAKIRVWDIAQKYAENQMIAAHLFAVNHLVYAPDGAYFASASMDKTIKIWNAANFQLLKVIDKARYGGHGSSVNKLLWLENRQIVSVSDDKSAIVWGTNLWEE
ncbi:WD domain-containing protein, G-beta repeat-containing protein [Flexibacter flexilis DSM 6793]|uniref:WD domain-containing protein, G-beta repeat-containing protein n=1 Tax=Flexibacter flexilis DSM 6793 TaxID=927664 RepID=A0A1I1NLU9_9BACT|nr:hypothetical protein [Flexibacter flexilis]SFC98435.1 WD domain-containing protein, G-beta repeat-containing protein [Flexibacter flexilis DSM 6793]